jgi:uncharacterized protein (TIGR02679 family)
MVTDQARLRELLAGAELAWLVERARTRLARGQRDGSVTLSNATPAQTEAVGRLLGRRPSGGASITVRLADVEAMLRHAGVADTLAEALEALGGPLIDSRAERRSAEAAWAALFDSAARDGRPRPWLEELRRTGVLRRLSDNELAVARTLLDRALEIERRLPAQAVALAELAAAVTADSHALDAGTPLGAIAVRVAASVGGLTGWDGTEAWRDAWTSAGVLCDELSAPVLVLNLPADGDRLTDRALRLHAESGEPYRLTTRQLLRQPPTFASLAAARSAVRVCENPTVLAAAANRHGRASAPLICLEGQPRTAARLLLDRLVAAGVRLAYHGDFDWPGIRIGNAVVRRHGALPWRFSSADYRAARGGRPLEGAPVAASWDPELEGAMVEVGRAVHEEEVLEALLADLG